MAFNIKQKEKKNVVLRYGEVVLTERPRGSLMAFGVEDNSNLMLSLPIRGGGVMKPWFKKNEALQTLTKKANKNVGQVGGL